MVSVFTNTSSVRDHDKFTVLLHCPPDSHSSYWAQTTRNEEAYILHQEYAWPHSARTTQDFLQAKKVEVMEHPLYSPDLAPCDFWLFPPLKHELRGIQFPSNASVATAIQRFFKTLTPDDFLKMFTNWRQRWDECITKEGCYFEKE